MRYSRHYSYSSTLAEDGKRCPLYTLEEIADMLKMDAKKLRAMIRTAARYERAFPKSVVTGGRSNYYRKRDFIKFLKQEEVSEHTEEN